jgi:hypothetical protein
MIDGKPGCGYRSSTAGGSRTLWPVGCDARLALDTLCHAASDLQEGHRSCRQKRCAHIKAWRLVQLLLLVNQALQGLAVNQKRPEIHAPLALEESATITGHWLKEMTDETRCGPSAAYVSGTVYPPQAGCPIHSKPAKWLRKSSMPDAPSSPRRARVESSPQRFNKIPPSAPLAPFCGDPPLRGKSPSPRTGRAFWKAKLTANIARDRLVNRTLRQAGWTIVRIWEHDLAKAARTSTPILYHVPRGLSGLPSPHQGRPDAFHWKVSVTFFVSSW